MDYMKLYETNKDFRTYVNRTSACYGISVEEALKRVIVRNVAAYYKENK